MVRLLPFGCAMKRKEKGGGLREGKYRGIQHTIYSLPSPEKMHLY